MKIRGSVTTYENLDVSKAEVIRLITNDKQITAEELAKVLLKKWSFENFGYQDIDFEYESDEEFHWRTEIEHHTSHAWCETKILGIAKENDRDTFNTLTEFIRMFRPDGGREDSKST